MGSGKNLSCCRVIEPGTKGRNLIIVMIKPIQSTNYGSSPEREVFPVDIEKVFWRHIIDGLLSTRLQQAVLLNSIKENVKVLEVEGWRSSVVRALVAKASGPGLNSPVTTKIFLLFSFAFIQTPLGEKVSIEYSSLSIIT